RHSAARAARPTGASRGAQCPRGRARARACRALAQGGLRPGGRARHGRGRDRPARRARSRHHRRRSRAASAADRALRRRRTRTAGDAWPVLGRDVVSDPFALAPGGETGIAVALRPRLPAPTRTRWQPLRLGLVNLYRFDDETFAFEDGRLLLRGNNGTGKSRVLALTLPFLFDGRIE